MAHLPRDRCFARAARRGGGRRVGEIAILRAPGDPMTTPHRQYRYYDFVMAAFVTVLVCSNLIGPAKIAQVELPLVGPLDFGAGVLFFPISYVFGDILTEVYGYARSRRVIWAGFGALGFASF